MRFASQYINSTSHNYIVFVESFSCGFIIVLCQNRRRHGFCCRVGGTRRRGKSMAAKARRKKRLIKVEPAHAAYRFSLGKSTVRTSDAGQRETPVVIFSSTLLIEAQFVGHLTPSHNLRALRACGQPFARENFGKVRSNRPNPGVSAWSRSI